MIPPHPNHLAILGLLISSTFLTTAKADSVNLNKNKYQFDQAISVRFTYPNSYVPKNRDWVGIFKDTDRSLPLTTYPGGGYLSFYLRICNQQNAPCPNSSPLPSTGTLKFYVTDPDSENNNQWPIPLGRYRACLIDDGASDNVSSGNFTVVGECKKFRVQKSKKSQNMARKSRVRVLKTTYAYKETISASFKNDKKITNAWVGIYEYSTTLKKVDREIIDNPLLWVYTGCNNVDGNQPTSHNCGKKKKHGQVDFREDNTGRAELDWPLPPGKYMMIFSCDNNNPHLNIKFNRTAFDII